MSLVLNLEFMRINIKSPKFSQCLNYHTQRVDFMLLKTGFLACPTRMGGSSLPCTSKSGIYDSGCHAYTLFYILKFSQSLRGGKRRSQKFRPTFKICSNVQQANKLLIESFFKEGSNPQFLPSLRDFTYNSHIW
jgi:hypothetical protein